MDGKLTREQAITEIQALMREYRLTLDEILENLPEPEVVSEG